MKIALLPGGFKPPHLGHYNMAKYLADFADKVVVRIGQKERDGIGKELALKIWNYYKAADSDERAQKLIISIANSPSPVKDVYDFVELTAPEGSTVILGLGEKDATDGRYNSIPKFAEPRNIKADIELVPPQAGGISGTRMREIIKSNNKEEFLQYIPGFLPEEIKEEIWTDLVDTTMPTDIEENIPSPGKSSAKGKEFKPEAKPEIKELTVLELLQTVKGIPYYKEVVDDLKKGDESWEVTKKVKEYAEYMKKNPNTLKNLPPINIIDGKLDDGAHRISAIYLLQNLLDPSNSLWKTIKLKTAFYTASDIKEMMAGTMNREEMAKHMANMEKLKKHLSKINAKGDMVPVPTDLTKGLRRKLYEGRYDAEVTNQSRFLIEEFKENFGEKYEAQTIGAFPGIEDDKKARYIIDYEFDPTELQKVEPLPFVIDGEADAKTMEIKVFYDPNKFPLAYNDLIAEIKDTIRHELEHISQFRLSKGVNPKSTKQSQYTWFQYFTFDYEVPAFVQGLYKNSKTKKITLTKAIYQFLSNYLDVITDEEEQIIIKTWTNWARKNLPAAQINEGDTYEKMAAKGKKAGNLKQGTVRKRLNIPKGEKIPLSLINKELSRLKKMEKRSAKNQKYYKALTLAKTLKTTTHKENIDPKAQKKHKGKSAPYGSAYEPVGENFPPYKANQVSQARYKASDTFTNDRKKAKKLGYLQEKDPKVGTGKKPKGSGRRLYTDENPKDTVSIKFSTRQDIVDTLSKKSFKSKSHARQSQIINLIHQRVRAALSRAKDPAVKKRLRSAFEYIKKRKEASKRKTQRMRKEGLFSKEWWLDVITEDILNEGGAAGHMAHPFDLPNVNNGKDLIKVFDQAADSLKKTPGSVKIDGVNASIRLIRDGDKRQFALDRGSKKALDLKGITKADLEDRFGPGHGMVKAGGNVLDIFNDALPSIEEELEALGLWNDSNIMFNMEYVSGKSNVQDYGKNFLAIHGLLSVETKEVQGARKILTKRITTEKNYDKADLEELLRKLEPFAKKKGFEIYGSVPTVFKKEPDFKSVLNKQYKIEFSGRAETKSLGQWLSQVNDIPVDNRLKMNLETGGTKDVGALSKQVYFAVFGGETVDDLFDNDQEIQLAIKGATTYLATEKLGDAILDVLDSPMGSVNDHEGVVIRDSKISPRPFKITGKFITGGVSSQFQAK